MGSVGRRGRLAPLRDERRVFSVEFFDVQLNDVLVALDGVAERAAHVSHVVVVAVAVVLFDARRCKCAWCCWWCCCCCLCQDVLFAVMKDEVLKRSVVSRQSSIVSRPSAVVRCPRSPLGCRESPRRPRRSILVRQPTQSRGREHQ